MLIGIREQIAKTLGFVVCTTGKIVPAFGGCYSNVRGEFGSHSAACTLADKLAAMGEDSQIFEVRTIAVPRRWTRGVSDGR